MTQYRQFCTFQLDRFTCGVDIRSIQEVIAWHEITPVPFTPPALRGLINLRGQMVIAIDLRRQFGLSDFAADQLPMNVVVQTTDGLVSLLVDRIGDVMEVADDAFERPPLTLQPRARQLIEGAYKLDDRLLLIVDLTQAVSAGAG